MNKQERPKWNSAHESKEIYMRRLAQYCSVQIPAYAFSPSAELEIILERIADLQDKLYEVVGLAEIGDADDDTDNWGPLLEEIRLMLGHKHAWGADGFCTTCPLAKEGGYKRVDTYA
jgi:hypothetical protein